MCYFTPHLKYVATLPLEILKFKFSTNLKENANKKCLTNQLNFHRYWKIKPRANFESTSMNCAKAQLYRRNEEASFVQHPIVRSLHHVFVLYLLFFSVCFCVYFLQLFSLWL